jgi:hypothetical protein
VGSSKVLPENRPWVIDNDFGAGAFNALTEVDLHDNNPAVPNASTSVAEWRQRDPDFGIKAVEHAGFAK